jgi:hypothetical protein
VISRRFYIVNIVYIHTLRRSLTRPALQGVLVKWGPISIVNGLYQKAVSRNENRVSWPKKGLSRISKKQLNKNKEYYVLITQCVNRNVLWGSRVRLRVLICSN